MVELLNVRNFGDKTAVMDFQGLSTDTKPTTDYACYKGKVNVDSDSTFYELDTKKLCVYSARNANAVTSNGWWEM
jgi:hypothetical protein